MKNVITPLLVAVIMAASVGLVASEITAAELETEVDAFVAAGMHSDCRNIPGISISVVRDNQIVMSKGYGVKKVGKSGDMDSSTLVGIGSLSNSITSNVIMQQIANQTTRLKSFGSVGGFRIDSYRHNLTIALLAFVAERLEFKITGNTKTWEELVDEKIFGPLSMNSSTFGKDIDECTANIAQGYVKSEYGDTLHAVPFNVTRNWGALGGSDGIFSNADDMANWMCFHLTNGKNRNNDIIMAISTINDAYTPQQYIRLSEIERYYKNTPVKLRYSNHGYGWNLGHYNEHEVITHEGNTIGYQSLITMIPSWKIGVFIAITGHDPDYTFRINVNSFILDHLMDKTPWMNATTLCSFPEPWTESQATTVNEPLKNITSNRDLSDFVGKYKHDSYGIILVYLDDNTTTPLKAKYGFGCFTLYPQTDDDTFYAEGAGLIENVKHIPLIEFETSPMSFKISSFNKLDPPKFTRQGTVTVPVCPSPLVCEAAAQNNQENKVAATETKKKKKNGGA